MNPLVDGRRALLEGFVDYAGMFPPASLPVEEAVAGYRRARSGPYGWMLGRFLCPSSRLDDLAGELTRTMATGERPWGVSAVIDRPGGSVDAAAFDRYMDPGARVVLVELAAPAEAMAAGDVTAVAGALAPTVDGTLAVSPDVTPFLEIPVAGADPAAVGRAVAALDALRVTRMRGIGAKMRTGGLTPAAFPTPDEAAGFVAACAGHKLPFKATAGMHHPLRHFDTELGVHRHGFLNLLTAAALAAGGSTPQDVTAAMAGTGSIAVGAAGITWEGSRIGITALRDMRNHLFPSYGSCSFDEPVDDLVALGILEATETV